MTNNFEVTFVAIKKPPGQFYCSSCRPLTLCNKNHDNIPMKFHNVILNTLHPYSFRVTFVAIKKPPGQFYSPSSRPLPPTLLPIREIYDSESEKYSIHREKITV